MKIITWNVNSIGARLPHLLVYLKDQSPDIALLQETKTVNENFPRMEIEDLGYNLAIHGQKSYNGVAILSKYAIEDVVTTLPGDDNDVEARYIEAVVKGFRVASVYVPNGMEIGHDKFHYKLKFFERLRDHAQNLLQYNEKLVMGGDYNVAPQAIDTHDPSRDGVVCYHPAERSRFHAIEYLGLTDAFRAVHPDKQKFSWWDYRAGAFQQNKGLRIDHLLLSAEAADGLSACDIDTTPRILERPSDHTPVWCDIN